MFRKTVFFCALWALFVSSFSFAGSLVENKALVEQFYESLNHRDYQKLSALVVPSFTRHSGTLSRFEISSRDDFLRQLRDGEKNYSSLNSKVERMVAEGDMVAVWGLSSSNLVNTGETRDLVFSCMFRVEGDQLAEIWITSNHRSVSDQQE